MLVQIVTENGQKKIIPLTADAGAGNPVGTIIPMYKKSSPSGYLYCDGSTFDQTKYPLLYAYLGSNVLPDYRECAIVGAEQNGTDTIADHDVYTEGQFKDDQLQNHWHELIVGNARNALTTGGADRGYSFSTSGTNSARADNIIQGRHGTVTRGKRKAVYFYIKATSGLSENAQDNVLAQLNEERSYSTDEINTGKKWIDGKPIYRKTLELTLPSSGMSGTIADLSGLNIDIVVNQIAVIFNNTNDFIIVNGSYSFTPEAITLFIRKTNGTLHYSRSTSTTTWGSPLKFTVEYTKTTD